MSRPLILAVFGGVMCLNIARCSTDDVPYEDIIRPAQRTKAEIDFAKQALDDLQDQSIQKNREYCGYIGLSPEGLFYATEPKRGRKGSCRPEAAINDAEILASYHTHGGYAEDFDSEIPSLDDVKAGMEEGLDGYIATPGGRLWFTEGETGASEMLCGLGCLTSDPDFDPDDAPHIKNTYTLDALEQLEE